MKIINLTQHGASPEQKKAGVVSAPYPLNNALTFSELPDSHEIAVRAEWLASIAADEGADAAMIGGAPYLMGPLEATLREKGIKPLYAFSNRVSVEQVQPDGSVTKINEFKHLGFVEA